MTRLILVKVGERDNLPLYAPLDAEDVTVCNNQNMLVVDKKGDKAARTELQNRSIHLYFTRLCDALNAAGWDMKATMEKLSKKAKIPWSPSAIKERLWRPVQDDTYGERSTTKLSTAEVSAVYEALNEVTGSQLGVSLPFPDKYSQMNEQLGRK